VVELATKNLATLRADWVHEYFGQSIPASIYDRCWLVRGLAELGRFAETEVYEAEAIRLAEATHHAWIIGWTHLQVGLVHLHRGDWAKACSLIERARAVLQTGNVVLNLAQTVAVSAWILAQLGDANEALNRLREGDQLAERHAATGGAASRSYQALSRAHLLLGRLDEARRLGRRAVELAAGYGSEVDAVHLLGDIETHPDRIDAVGGDAYYRRALAHAEPRGMRPLVAHCHLGLGKFYRHMGKLQEAEEHLVAATTMYREMGMTYWLEKTQKEVAKMQ